MLGIKQAFFPPEHFGGPSEQAPRGGYVIFITL